MEKNGKGKGKKWNYKEIKVGQRNGKRLEIKKR